MAKQPLTAPSNRGLAVAGAILLFTLAALPATMALNLAWRNGLAWTGINIFSPGDLAVYLTYIDQAKSGAWLMGNLFDTGAAQPALHGFWLLVGWLARWLRLDAMSAYHLARLALVPALAWAVWQAVRRFLPSGRQRIVAYLLVLFGGGLGGFAEPFYAGQPISDFAPNRPVDLWVSEAFPFLSSQYSGHFLAAWILFLLCLVFFWRALDEKRRGLSLAAGLLAVLLATFHPYHLVTVFIVAVAWLGYRQHVGRAWKSDWRTAWPFAVLLVSAIAVNAIQLVFGPAGEMMSRRSLALTPRPLELLIGYGLFVPLAAIGWRAAKRQNWPESSRAFLAVWAIAQPFAFYGPWLMQRRLLLGWLFPLALLATPGLLDISQRVRRLLGGLPRPVLALPAALGLCLLFNVVPTTLLSMRDAFAAPNYRQLLFLDQDRQATLNWVRQNTPTDAVFLSSPSIGNQIAGWAHRPVFVGHWANTDRLADKNETLVRFMGPMTPAERRALIKDHGLKYLWCENSTYQNGTCPPKGLPAIYRFGRGSDSIFEIR